MEKNIFIKRIITNTKLPHSRILIKSNLVSNNNIKRLCYLKPHPIFIISNSINKNKFGINNNLKLDSNSIYLKTNNTDRNIYNFDNDNIIIDKKSNIKEKNEGNNIFRSKSYDIGPFEHITKIRKYFNNKFDKIKKEYHLDKLNEFDDDYKSYNLTERYENINTFDKTIDNTNYNNKIFSKKLQNKNPTNFFKYKSNTINININDHKNKMKIKSSKSTDIVNLCKILKSLYNYKKGTVIGEENSKGGIVSLSIASFENKKNLSIIKIQKNFRGYYFRKNFIKYLYKLKKFSDYEYLKKIILIQRAWKKYLMIHNTVNMSFSFTNSEDNNKIIINSNNNSNKKNSNLPNKIILKPCFISKRYFSRVDLIISYIILIQKNIKKFLSTKIAKNSCGDKKKIKKNSKSRNKPKKKNKNIIENMSNNINNFKSLIIISPEKEFDEFISHTSNKEKINKKIIFENLIKNAENEVYFKLLNNACFISKKRKDINFVKKVLFLQKHMKFCLNKKKFMVNIIKKINNICYFDKIIINGFNYNLEKKIILIQRNIKNFLKTKNNNYKIKTNNKYLSSNNAFQSTNEISNKKNEQNEPNNINTISEFNLYENSFISNNVNAISFDFKDIQNENIEDDDNNIINTKKENIIKTLNFGSKNKLIITEKQKNYKKLKQLFINSITNKFANFLTNALNKLYLYNFIKIFVQKISKSINQYVFYIITNKRNNEKYINFFAILKRHIKYNLNNNIHNNEIKFLLMENLPQCFHDYKKNNKNINNDYLVNIPYINHIQERNLINTELFINNDENLINYIINFYNKEKGNFDFESISLRNILNNRKLKNRNIFTITKYFDDIYNDIINKKLCLKCLNNNCTCNDNKNKTFNYIKKKCINISKMQKEKQRLMSKKAKANEMNMNEEFFKSIDENINSENINDLNNSHILGIKSFNYKNMYTYHCENIANNDEYKFFDYINEKCRNNNYNETLPLTNRYEKDYFINRNKFI